jgi:CheY-like chemotaxis protein
MRIRRILLAHPLRSFRALIQKYVFTELSDVEICEAESREEAFWELNLHPYDVIVASGLILDASPSLLREKLSGSPFNRNIPVIVLSEDENGADEERWKKSGFDHIVPIRLRPADLIGKINTVCNPRMWRKHKRFCIPDTGAEICVRDIRLQGTLINISRGGLLLRLITKAKEAGVLMYEDLWVDLQLPEHWSGPSVVKGLPARLLNLHVVEWHSDNSPAILRATLVFSSLTKEQAVQIEEILGIALEEKAVPGGGNKVASNAAPLSY